MALTMSQRKAVTKTIATRHERADNAGKGGISDEFRAAISDLLESRYGLDVQQWEHRLDTGMNGGTIVPPGDFRAPQSSGDPLASSLVDKFGCMWQSLAIAEWRSAARGAGK
jgi:hypothetical protein